MTSGRHHNDDPRTNTNTTADSTPGSGPDVGNGAERGVAVSFTARGAAALEELADSLTADLIASLADGPACINQAPLPAIEALLGRVMSAEVGDLAAGLIAADAANDAHIHGSPEAAIAERARSGRQLDDEDATAYTHPPGPPRSGPGR